MSQNAFSFTALPPLSLYVHLPWCVRKCPYCDFNSHQARGGLSRHPASRDISASLRVKIPEADYVAALLADLEHDLPRVWGRPVRSIFIGGGTPSLFSPAAIDRLLSGIHARLSVAPDAEVTLEANPGSVELERFRGYRAAGVNRLSIGTQSFDDEKLKAVGRIHGREEALAAAAAARAAGFDSFADRTEARAAGQGRPGCGFNLDLMFGLPGQTVDQALADVRTAIAQQPAHLSVYQLTIEPNTLFHARPPMLPDDDAVWAMQQAIQAELAAAGFEQYEVSAYARPGRECRHNLNYWRFGDYLGIGAGAHAKLTDAGGVMRLWKVKQPEAYLGTAGTAQATGGIQALTPEDVAFEFMLNALRLTEGFPAGLFEERTGLALAAIEPALRVAETKGLVRRESETIRPTDTGRRLLNDLLQLFLP